MDTVFLCAFKNIMDDHSFSMDEKINVLKICIDNGVDINYNNSDILIQAIHGDNLPIITFLIDSGIDIETNNKILILACLQQSTQILKVLLSAGLTLTPDNFIIKYYSENYTNLDIELDIIIVLVENGADPFSHGNALLEIACYNKDYDLVTYLINIGAKCNELSHKAIRYLFYKYGFLKIKKLFLENGTNPNVILPIRSWPIENEILPGESCPLENAILQKDFETCKLLLEYGADINLCSNIINENYDMIDLCLHYYRISDQGILDNICNLFPDVISVKIRNIFLRERNKYKTVRSDTCMIEYDDNNIAVITPLGEGNEILS